MGDEMVLERLPGIEQNRAVAGHSSHPLVSYDDPAIRAEHELLREINNSRPKQHQTENIQRLAGLALGLSSVFTENILSHPFIVLRRQCQVHHNALSYQIHPFLLPHVIYNLQRNQSLGTLWKGIGSCFISRGIGLATEAVVSEFTPFPREVSRHSSLKKLSQHLGLKSFMLLLNAPFFAASLIETVQSEIASEKFGVLDCVKEGFTRLVGWNAPTSFHMLPVWKIMLPFMAYGLMHYTVTSMAQYSVLHALRTDIQEDQELAASGGDPPARKSMLEIYFPELIANFTGNLLADALLFPMETVVHRLLLQGTRTIIDNTDSGLGVTPINTSYSGFYDCVKSIILDEGVSGFYKGFGALILQYTIHALILKFARVLFEKIARELNYYNGNSTRGSSSSSATRSSARSRVQAAVAIQDTS